MAQSLKDRVAIVTGSSSGIGEAVAILFASRGAKVTLCGRNTERLKAALDKTVKAGGGDGARFLTVQGDVNDAKVREEIVSKTVEKFGRLDILVANAAVLLGENSLAKITEQTYDKVMNSNLKSTFFLIQQAVPHLEKTQGCIIATSSIGGQVPSSHGYTYGSSKAALDHMCRCFALDLGPKGIRVNAVSPAFIPTNIFAGVVGSENVSEFIPVFTELEKGKTPLCRLGKSEDVAELMAFLASDAASFITGQNIQVDGGRSLVADLEHSDKLGRFVE